MSPYLVKLVTFDIIFVLHVLVFSGNYDNTAKVWWEYSIQYFT